MTKYKIKPPLGSVVISKEYMTEQELRDFALQIVSEPDTTEGKIWVEKITKDSIADVVEWLTRSGYEVEEIK